MSHQPGISVRMKYDLAKSTKSRVEKSSASDGIRLESRRQYSDRVEYRLMRAIAGLGYRLTEFAYLAAANKAARAGNLAFPCKPDRYLLDSYRIATTPEPNSNRLTSFMSTGFDSPANNVGPWPASLGCIKNSHSSINPSSANASGSFTPPMSSPLPDPRLSC